jgi:hypothetical protein
MCSNAFEIPLGPPLEKGDDLEAILLISPLC